jgi:hypothetical protein
VIHVTTSAAGLYYVGTDSAGRLCGADRGQGIQPDRRCPMVVHAGNTTSCDVKMLVGPERPQVDGSGRYGRQHRTSAPCKVWSTGDKIDKAADRRDEIFLTWPSLSQGLQVQDGSVFGASKNGLSSISFLNQLRPRGED